LYDTEARAIARMEYALDVTAWWKWRRKRRIRRHLADMRARSGKWGALMEAQGAYIASMPPQQGDATPRDSEEET
jgi:hypothetical protein